MPLLVCIKFYIQLLSLLLLFSPMPPLIPPPFQVIIAQSLMQL